MAVTDKMSKLSYVDPDRMVAAGGSYGGYMIDWILGHTTRFKALISHDGVYDLRSEAGETEELWFPRLGIQRHALGRSRNVHALVAKSVPKEFKTPTLVIHGELDYRVPLVRVCSYSPPSRCKKCHRSCWFSPMRDTGC